jgi:hypothetical protein
MALFNNLDDRICHLRSHKISIVPTSVNKKRPSLDMNSVVVIPPNIMRFRSLFWTEILWSCSPSQTIVPERYTPPRTENSGNVDPHPRIGSSSLSSREPCDIDRGGRRHGSPHLGRWRLTLTCAWLCSIAGLRQCQDGTREHVASGQRAVGRCMVV